MTINLTRQKDVDWLSGEYNQEKQDDDADWVPYVGPREGSGWQSVDDGSVTYAEDPPGNKVGEELEDADKEEVVEALDEVFGTEFTEEMDNFLFTREELLQDVQDAATPEELADVAEAVDVSEDNEDETEDEQTGLGILGDIEEEFDNIEDEVDDNEAEEQEVMDESEQSEIFQDRIDQLPMPGSPKEPEEGDGIDPEPEAWDDIDEEDIDSVASAQETLTRGEMLGIGVDISEETDDLPFGEDTDIPVYDNAKYPSIDVAMDTGDFSNLQAKIHETYQDTPRENHYGTADPDRVQEYAEIIEGDEETMPRPYIVLDRDGDVMYYQEGRHRALAAIEAGEEDIPVRVLVDNSKDVK